MKLSIFPLPIFVRSFAALALLILVVWTPTHPAWAQNLATPLTFPASIGPFTLLTGDGIAASAQSSEPFVQMPRRAAADLCRIVVSWVLLDAETGDVLAELSEILEPEDPPASLVFRNGDVTPKLVTVHLEVAPAPSQPTSLPAINAVCNSHGALELTSGQEGVKAAIAIPNLLECRSIAHE